MSQQVLDGVRDLLPTFRSRAEETERLRVIPDASSRSSRRPASSGCSSHVATTGSSPTRSTSTPRSRRSPGACGSTGWVSAVVGVHPWQVALFADEAQQAVWGDDTDTRLSSSYAPTGKALLTDGGFTLSGRWSFSSGLATTASGCCWAGWCSTPRARSSTSAPSWCRAATTRSRTSGTSSACAAPAPTTSSSRTSSCPRRSPSSMSDTGRCFGPGQEVNTSNLYKLPFHSVFTMTISTPLIGMAYGAYDEHVEMQRKRVRAAYLAEKTANDPYATRAHRPGLQRDRRRLGAAGAQPRASSRPASSAARRSRCELRLRVRRDQVIASERAIRAIDTMFESSGGRALAEGTYLQRAWRDAHAGRVHAANDPERALAMFGSLEFGHKIDPGMY